VFLHSKLVTRRKHQCYQKVTSKNTLVVTNIELNSKLLYICKSATAIAKQQCAAIWLVIRTACYNSANHNTHHYTTLVLLSLEATIATKSLLLSAHAYSNSSSIQYATTTESSSSVTLLCFLRLFKSSF
jgi:hypothetical protein